MAAEMEQMNEAPVVTVTFGGGGRLKHVTVNYPFPFTPWARRG
ncbi:MAG TPA: hypothetical protein VIV56_14115 [Gemmatimonadales bacterium]